VKLFLDGGSVHEEPLCVKRQRDDLRERLDIVQGYVSRLEQLTSFMTFCVSGQKEGRRP
jgi:hypothetical protein